MMTTGTVETQPSPVHERYLRRLRMELAWERLDPDGQLAVAAYAEGLAR